MASRRPKRRVGGKAGMKAVSCVYLRSSQGLAWLVENGYVRQQQNGPLIYLK